MLIPILATAGCETTEIDPFSNDGNYYSVYGYLDELETEHAIRVIPVTRYAERIMDPSDPQANLDAEVFTTDLSTGARTRWTHHLEKLSDGSYGHIFRAHINLTAQKTYELEIIRSDGARTTARTRVPYIHSADMLEMGPVVFEADSTIVYRDVKIPEISSPWEIQSIYMWGGSSPAQSIINRRIYVPYGRAGSRTADGGWAFRLNLSEDQAVVRDDMAKELEMGRLETDVPTGVTVAGVQIRILDEGWDPPEGIFDPEILSQPGRLSNVENGFGYFGSIGLYIQEWNIEHLSVALGYDY